MKNPEEYLAKVSATKLKLRRELAALSYPEKIRRVVEMQRLARDFRRDRSRTIYVWELE